MANFAKEKKNKKQLSIRQHIIIINFAVHMKTEMGKRAGEMVISRFNWFEHKITVMMARHQFCNYTLNLYAVYAGQFVFSFLFEEAIIEISIVAFNSFWMPTKRISTHTILTFQFWQLKYTHTHYARTQSFGLGRLHNFRAFYGCETCRSNVLFQWKSVELLDAQLRYCTTGKQQQKKKQRNCRAPIEWMMKVVKFSVGQPDFVIFRIKFGTRQSLEHI